MKQFILIIIAGLFSHALLSQADFLAEQKRYERVRDAIKEKQQILEKVLSESKITVENLNLLFVAYKDDDLLDVYAKSKHERTYKKILSYKVCSRSGKLGPKRKQGDKQVPEGFYYIDRFNPASTFHLSLGISYPNLADKRKSKAANLGGDIFIHGSCVTIGCLPMTDTYIKEIYLLAIYAKNSGQSTIPVYLFPFKMTDQNFKAYKTKYEKNPELIKFWENLKIGHDEFLKEKAELKIEVTESGDYLYPSQS